MNTIFLKDLLLEDPDIVFISGDQKGDLEKKGTQIKPARVASLSYRSGDSVSYFYDDPEAVTFVYDIKGKEVIYVAPNASYSENSNVLTHPDVGLQIVAYWENAPEFSIKVEGFKGTSFEAGEDLEDIPGENMGKIYALNKRSVKDMHKYLMGLDDRVPLDGDISRTNKKFILGRLWTTEAVISFWREKKVCLDHMDEFIHLMRAFNVNPREVIYEFRDVEHLFTFGELNKDVGTSRTDAEQKALMAKQHINPLAKKQLAAMNNIKQRVPVGFEDLPARKDAMMPALEETDATFSDYF